MFGWFRAASPLDVDVRVRVEQLFLKLATRIGADRIRRCTVLTPDHSDLPRRYEGTDEETHQVFDVAARHLGLSAKDIDLEFAFLMDRWSELSQAMGVSGPNGLYFHPSESKPRPLIAIDAPLRHDPGRLLATMLHELAHEFLRQHFPEAYEDSEMEHLTDLLPVILGAGIFHANTCLSETSQTLGMTYSWKIARSGYLYMNELAYSLALFAWVRDEAKPDWTTYLRNGVREPMRQSLRYLMKTSDVSFELSEFGRGPQALSFQQVEKQLHSQLPSRRFHALQQLMESFPDRIPELAEQLKSMIRREERPIRIKAIEAAAFADESSVSLTRMVMDQQFDLEVDVRAAVARTLRPNGPLGEQEREQLESLLKDQSLTVATCAAQSLLRCSTLSRDLLDLGCRLLRQAVNDCNSEQEQIAIEFLSRIPNAEPAVLNQTGIKLSTVTGKKPKERNKNRR